MHTLPAQRRFFVTVKYYQSLAYLTYRNARRMFYRTHVARLVLLQSAKCGGTVAHAAAARPMTGRSVLGSNALQ